jgi:hypothetical protein
MKEQSKQEQQVDSQVIAAEKTALKTHTSKGEKLFNILTYGGISGVSVFIGSVLVGYSAKYGKRAAKFPGKVAFLEKYHFSKQGAEHAVMTTELMHPGNAAVLPIKLIEDHKPEIIDKLNHLLGDKSGDASINKEPEQTWGSLIKGRLAAWAAVYTGFRVTAKIIGDTKFAEFENAFAEKACNLIGKNTHTNPLNKIAENETKAFRFGKIAAIDLFATIAATTLLYAGSKFFAKKNPTWKARDLPPDVKVAEENLDAALSTNTNAEPAKSFATSLSPRTSSFSQNITNQKTVANSTSALTH